MGISSSSNKRDELSSCIAKHFGRPFVSVATRSADVFENKYLFSRSS